MTHELSSRHNTMSDISIKLPDLIPTKFIIGNN